MNRLFSLLDNRLNPMVVKDFRQGISSNSFVSVFILTQACMIILFIIGAATADQGGLDEVVNILFWGVISVLLLLFQPLRGLAGLSGEIKERAIDLLVLTQLDTRRIVYGKWASLISQTFILLSALLPYFLLRYFFGGVNLVQEVVILSVMFFVSMTLSSVTLAISAYNSPWAIVVFLFIGIFVGPYLIGVVAALAAVLSAGWGDWAAVISTLLIGGAVMLLMRLIILGQLPIYHGRLYESWLPPSPPPPAAGPHAEPLPRLQLWLRKLLSVRRRTAFLAALAAVIFLSVILTPLVLMFSTVLALLGATVFDWRHRQTDSLP